MRNNILYLVGLLSLFLFLGSCQSDEESGKVGNGKPMEVKFRFDGIKEFQNASPNARWANGEEKSQTVTQELGNGRVMEATIVPDEDGGAMTRGMTVIDPATQIVVIAYHNGKPYKKKTITSDNASIELPMGETYDFVFYAGNNKNSNPPYIVTGSDLHIDDGLYPEGETGVKGETDSEADAIWYKAENVYVSADMSPLTVVFQHIFSRIRLQITDKDNLYNITVSRAYAVPTGDHVAVDVTTGTWYGPAVSSSASDFTFPNNNDKSVTSDYEVFIPMFLDFSILASFKLGDSFYSDKLLHFPEYVLLGGKSYTIKLNVKASKSYSVEYNANGGDVGSVPASQTKIVGTDFTLPVTKPTRTNCLFLGWALTADATTPAFVAGASVSDADLGNSTVANPSVTLYAVWQILIAEPGETGPRIYVSGSGNSAKLLLTQSLTNYGTFFQFGRVIAWNYNNTGPANYNPSISGSSTWIWNLTYGGEGGVIHTNADLKVGKGDPCRLVGMTAGDIRTALIAGQTPDNGLWRLPTNAEHGMLQEYGFGNNADGSITNVFFFDNLPLGFCLPLPGFRDRDGYYANQGSEGYYWSNNQVNYQVHLSYRLYFNSGNQVILQDERAGQNYGLSVRCVRQ